MDPLIVVSSLNLTAKAPENEKNPKRKLIFQPSIFRCKLLVSGRVVAGKNQPLKKCNQNQPLNFQGLKQIETTLPQRS